MTTIPWITSEVCVYTTKLIFPFYSWVYELRKKKKDFNVINDNFDIDVMNSISSWKTVANILLCRNVSLTRTLTWTLYNHHFVIDNHAWNVSDFIPLSLHCSWNLPLTKHMVWWSAWKSRKAFSLLEMTPISDYLKSPHFKDLQNAQEKWVTIALPFSSTH